MSDSFLRSQFVQFSSFVSLVVFCIAVPSKAMAVVPIDSQLIVREYQYFMDGVRTGTLFLLDGPEHPRQISWWSVKTNKQTLWQGMWFSPTGNPDDTISGNFDHSGRRDLALRKYFRVKRRGDLGFVGKDYMDRVILLVHLATHTYANTGLLGRRDDHVPQSRR